jgi:hypothetical protein
MGNQTKCEVTQNHKANNAYNWPSILFSWGGVWRRLCLFCGEMSHRVLRHFLLASILDHRVCYKPVVLPMRWSLFWECMMTNKKLFDLVVKFTVSSIISDSFFLSDRDSFEMCSSSAWRTLSALAVHHLRGRWRSEGFSWQRNSAPQTLSTLYREDCLHFGAIHS